MAEENTEETKKDEKKIVYYWAICNDCGTKYDYAMPFCPTCTKNNRRSSGYKVQIANELPENRIIRWNKPWLAPYDSDTQLCINCEKPEQKFCPHFGEPNYSCEFFRTCECVKCCSFYARRNRKLNEKKEA